MILSRPDHAGRHRALPLWHGAWAVVLLLLPVQLAWHPLRSSVSEVEQGNTRLEAGDAEGALQQYELAATKIPENPALLYDRGLALLRLGRLEEALEPLTKAASGSDPEVRYRASFALGLLHYQQESWDEAVQAFKGALRLRPTDDDARLNYELAWARLHPPCRLLEDAQEENDTADTAKLLSEPLQEPLRLCPGDPDWFAVDVPAGAALFIAAKVLGDPAPLVLSLVGPDGAPLQEAQGDQELAVELRQAEQAGRHLFRVSVVGDAQPAYELAVEVQPPCPLGEDALEENDSLAAAHELGKGEQKGLRICPADEDWYSVLLPPG